MGTNDAGGGSLVVDRSGRLAENRGRLVGVTSWLAEKGLSLVTNVGLLGVNAGRLVANSGVLGKNTGPLVEKPGRLVEKPGTFVDNWSLTCWLGGK